MARVKGVFENGVIKPLEKVDLAEKEPVEILYREKPEKKRKSPGKFPSFKARDLALLKGFFAVGGDAVKDADRYYE